MNDEFWNLFTAVQTNLPSNTRHNMRFLELHNRPDSIYNHWAWISFLHTTVHHLFPSSFWEDLFTFAIFEFPVLAFEIPVILQFHSTFLLPTSSSGSCGQLCSPLTWLLIALFLLQIFVAHHLLPSLFIGSYATTQLPHYCLSAHLVLFCLECKAKELFYPLATALSPCTSWPSRPCLCSLSLAGSISQIYIFFLCISSHFKMSACFTPLRCTCITAFMPTRKSLFFHAIPLLQPQNYAQYRQQCKYRLPFLSITLLTKNSSQESIWLYTSIYVNALLYKQNIEERELVVKISCLTLHLFYNITSKVQ